MAEDSDGQQITVAELLKRMGAEQQDASPSGRRRRRSDEGGVSVSDSGEIPRITDDTVLSGRAARRRARRRRRPRRWSVAVGRVRRGCGRPEGRRRRRPTPPSTARSERSAVPPSSPHRSGADSPRPPVTPTGRHSPARHPPVRPDSPGSALTPADQAPTDQAPTRQRPPRRPPARHPPLCRPAPAAPVHPAPAVGGHHATLPAQQPSTGPQVPAARRMPTRTPTPVRKSADAADLRPQAGLRRPRHQGSGSAVGADTGRTATAAGAAAPPGRGAAGARRQGSSAPDRPEQPGPASGSVPAGIGAIGRTPRRQLTAPQLAVGPARPISRLRPHRRSLGADGQWIHGAPLTGGRRSSAPARRAAPGLPHPPMPLRRDRRGFGHRLGRSTASSVARRQLRPGRSPA